MALFGTKKDTKKVKTTAVKTSAEPTLRGTGEGRDLAYVLKHARITEKATMHQAAGVYTFDIATNATKRDVIAAVQALYKVTPRMVHVVTVPAKQTKSTRTGKRGMKSGGKKAYVYLKSGETITIH